MLSLPHKKGAFTTAGRKFGIPYGLSLPHKKGAFTTGRQTECQTLRLSLPHKKGAFTTISGKVGGQVCCLYPTKKGRSQLFNGICAPLVVVFTPQKRGVHNTPITHQYDGALSLPHKKGAFTTKPTNMLSSCSCLYPTKKGRSQQITKVKF